MAETPRQAIVAENVENFTFRMRFSFISFLSFFESLQDLRVDSDWLCFENLGVKRLPNLSELNIAK